MLDSSTCQACTPHFDCFQEQVTANLSVDCSLNGWALAWCRGRIQHHLCFVPGVDNDSYHNTAYSIQLSSNAKLPKKFHGNFATPLEYLIPLIRWSLGCVSLLNQIYLILDNIALFNNTTPINLINLLCILLNFNLFILINTAGQFNMQKSIKYEHSTFSR